MPEPSDPRLVRITSVAFELGYDSPSTFISAFRQALGKTPRRYLDA